MRFSSLPHPVCVKRPSRLRAALIGCALLVSTASWGATPGWFGPVKVKSLVVITNGGVNVRTEPDLTGCVSQGGYGSLWASIYPSHPGINRLKADLLTAYVTGSQVSLYLNDSNCTVIELILNP